MPDLILDSVRTILTLQLAYILNGPEVGFVIVLTATRRFVEFANKYT
jgi:hypothetical protein